MPVIEANGVALPTISREDQDHCVELLQRWMVALNSYDAPGMKSVMRFPHVRLAENRLVIYQADDNPMDLFTRLVRTVFPPAKGIRLLGVTLSSFENAERSASKQLDLGLVGRSG